MITLEQLNEQNHHITADLFFQYVDEVKRHLEITDNDLYPQLLTHKDRRVQNMANRFMGGSQEIKRIFGQYLHKWCRPRRHELVLRDHDQFLRETHEMFKMVLDRLQDETEQLYPAIREVKESPQAVA